MKVKIVSHQAHSVLVEYFDNGMPKRCVLPAQVMTGEYVSQKELDRGVEFGAPWDEIGLDATPEKLCANLRNAGVWTVDDLRRKPEVVIGVLQATYGVDYQTLLRKFGGN